MPRESRYESNHANMFNYEEDLGVPSVVSMDDPIDIEQFRSNPVPSRNKNMIESLKQPSFERRSRKERKT